MAPSLSGIDLVSIITFTLIIVLALIYSIPIICIRRFHRNNHMLTLNICFATIFCGLSWFSLDAVALLIGRDGNISLFAIFNMITFAFTIQVPFSFVVASIHRCCSIIYHAKAFFKTRQWIALCIGSQWLLCLVLSLPNYISINTRIQYSIWLAVFNLIGIAIIPSAISFITNMLIYYHVRVSSRRVQSETSNTREIHGIKISRRDLYLLRHMVLMFCIFLGGWTPLFIIPIVHHFTPVIYHVKIFLRKKRWVLLCIASQWTLGFTLSLLNVLCIEMFCGRFVWLQIHNLITIVIIPSILNLLINILIYNYVWASSNRIQPQMIPGNVQRTKFSRRDMKLVRHMIFMFYISVGGWTPIYIIPIINYYSVVNTMISLSLTILCKLTSFIIIIDLFLYNHDLRKYFKRSYLKFVSKL
ncbi:unnamed protein product [Rotaria socialis]|uniref:G-protein coupled receptors family 1 profile domain-containing protein n=1 Tax=Rotaria socialis TaxID=392032 RepID=A0A820EPX2_9BILA|nr:unnamed protein product [Rotaria socialis]CAF4249633.1 unnamed protein product [Rotaria socialis]CAF4421628.1 unnamed protein product [Rotaria socialis]CAF4538998.1 unnamed protein product [Rotaria socialis]CAF4616033.1 unnamed protein product [Rotaria socialis]